MDSTLLSKDLQTEQPIIDFISIFPVNCVGRSKISHQASPSSVANWLK
jgi:hypothetical protein